MCGPIVGAPGIRTLGPCPEWGVWHAAHRAHLPSCVCSDTAHCARIQEHRVLPAAHRAHLPECVCSDTEHSAHLQERRVLPAAHRARLPDCVCSDTAHSARLQERRVLPAAHSARPSGTAILGDGPGARFARQIQRPGAARAGGGLDLGRAAGRPRMRHGGVVGVSVVATRAPP